MTTNAKIFWLVLLCVGLAISGCAHRKVLYLPPPAVEDADPNRPDVSDIEVPPVPSADLPATAKRIAQAKRDAAIDALGQIAEVQALAGLIVYWTNPPTPARWPGSSKRWPADWYFSGLTISTDLVTWTEYVRVAYATNCSVPVVPSGNQMFFRAFNGPRSIPRSE